MTRVARNGVAILAAVLLLGLTLSTPSAVATPRLSTRRCTRDDAADLRWIRWLSKTFEGREPSAASTHAWLPSFAKGVPYDAIATYLASGPGASRRVARETFLAVLHRRATEADVAAWGPWTAAHGPTALAVALGSSAEAFARGGGTNATWLDRVYPDLLGRPIDAAAKSYWLDRLATGTPRATVVTALWNSPVRVRMRLDAIYRLVLGRGVDPAAVTFWSPQVVAKGDAGATGALAATATAWARAQRTYGGTSTAQPPVCPPPPPGWVPAPGAVVGNLTSQAARGPRLIALTFDDGPNPTWTPQVLAILDRYQIPATFFVVGSWAQKYPGLVRQELDAGHHVGTHTMTHHDLRTLGPGSQRNEIVGGADLVDRLAGGPVTHCLRPPYGNRNASTDRIARDRGLASILWSRDGQDWKVPGVDTIVRGNLDTRFDGGRGIILLHDGGGNRSQTIAALPRLIEALQAQGYEFVQIC